jgi:type I restriction enzyme R subunit
MPRAKATLKEKWADMQKVYSSRSRLEKIADDIIFDFEIQERLKNGRGNAILVADSIYSACKFYEIFVSRGFFKCAIITSFAPEAGDLRTEATGEDVGSEEAFYKYNIYQKMLGLDPEHPLQGEALDKKVSEFEHEARRKFVDEPYNMKLLIVVDKLLTGFDAHPCTCLYIDKNMQDHGLFQAVCRVNRLDGEDKEFGYIVDYKQLFQKLEVALNTYASDYAENAFAGYEPKDIEGLLKDRKETSKHLFLSRLEQIENLCEDVPSPRDQIDYEHFFCGENGMVLDEDEIYARRRSALYSSTNKLIRAYAEVKPYFDDLEFSLEEQEKFEKKVSFYTELKLVIGRASGDLIDLKAYEPDMRYLIDNFVTAGEGQKLGEFNEYTLLDFVKAENSILTKEGEDPRKKESAAESIENNIAKEIVERKVVNPKYYEKMSTLLAGLVEERKRGAIAYQGLLERYLEIIKNVQKPEESGRYPESIKGSAALRALFDNFGEDEQLALKIHQAVLDSAMEGFRTNQVKARQVKKRLYQIFGDRQKVESAFKLIIEQDEY